VRELRAAAEADLGPLGRAVVCGRPARFSSAETPEDDALAETRLRAALALAGFDEVVFEFEPVAAALGYQQRLDHEELVLIADFGGGTSDFSLGPARAGARRDRRRRRRGDRRRRVSTAA
jgi:hypothetical chaperone protein